MKFDFLDWAMLSLAVVNIVGSVSIKNFYATIAWGSFLGAIFIVGILQFELEETQKLWK